MQQCTDESNFVGDYQAGKRHGWGTYTFPNGDRYMGQYREDLPHGYGVYIFASGQTYEGEWLMGRKNGWCIYTVDTGEQWAGQHKCTSPSCCTDTRFVPGLAWMSAQVRSVIVRQPHLLLMFDLRYVQKSDDMLSRTEL